MQGGADKARKLLNWVPEVSFEVCSLTCIVGLNEILGLFSKRMAGNTGCQRGTPHTAHMKQIKKPKHVRTRRECRKHERQASVFHISRVFSNVLSVLFNK